MAPDALMSCMVLNFIRITMWSLMYAGNPKHVYSSPYLNGFMPLSNLWTFTFDFLNGLVTSVIIFPFHATFMPS